jgi:hypothetical protein
MRGAPKIGWCGTPLFAAAPLPVLRRDYETMRKINIAEGLALIRLSAKRP